MKRIIIPALALAACTPQQTLDAQRYQAEIARVCNVAMMLAPIAGPVAPWLIGACATEAAVARLALDPSSLAWLQGIIGRLR
jgi:hypothetical protein